MYSLFHEPLKIHACPEINYTYNHTELIADTKRKGVRA